MLACSLRAYDRLPLGDERVPASLFAAPDLTSVHGPFPRPSLRAAQFGHSGDGPAVPLVDYSAPPADRAQRLKVVQVRGGREADSDSR